MIIANYFIYNFKVFFVLIPLKNGVNSEERILIYESHIDVLGNYTKKEIRTSISLGTIAPSSSQIPKSMARKVV
jgi:hypothetical protein